MGLFLSAVMPFHLIEHIFVSTTSPGELTVSSFLFNPVPLHGYCVAMLFAITEYNLHLYFYSGPSWLSYFGFVGSLSGWIFRSVALFTARANFTHKIRDAKHPDHELITWGIYSLVRHPGYAGWFVWSVSTQVILQNPISLVLYFAVSFLFFKTRIEGEEYLLVRFFGSKYLEYAKAVPCGIPFTSRLDNKSD